MRYYLHLCFLVLALCAVTSCQQAEELTSTNLAKDYVSDCFSDDRLYNISVDTEAKTATINNFRYCDLSNVVIPSTITYLNEKYTVIGIEKLYKNGNENVTSITLPNTLKTIGYQCFMGASITEIDIPDSVTYIGGVPFKAAKS